MPISLVNGLPLLSIVFGIAVLLGGLWVFRRAYTRDLSALQERLINTYKAQNEALETELRRLRRELAAMRLGFKHLGVTIEIEGNDIILTDEGKPKSTRVTAVHMEDEQE